jgi:hypothetical protein
MLAAVYYVFDHGELGPRLVREFRRVPKSTGVVRAAVDAMLHLEPLDPDYTSFWPRTAKIRGIRINGDTATVDLSAEARLRIDRAVEIASMQQLVWTVTAAAPKVTKVKVLVAGRTPPSSQSDWSGPQRRAKRSDTVARVQISSPQHGATVSRKLTIAGEARTFEEGFETAINWSVVDVPRKTVYAEGFLERATGERGSWRVTAQLPADSAGKDVEISAWEDPSDEGPPIGIDTKVVTVR